MSVQAAAGYPQYANVDIAYIPHLFAKTTLVKYYAKSVVPAITNTKYEGVIRDQGDEVIIRTRPDINVFDYKKGQQLNPETPSSPPIKLLIDKAKGYDFVIDVIDEHQADIVLSDEFTSDASEKQRIEVDLDVLGNVYADAAAANKGATAGKKSAAYNLGVTGTPVELTKTNIIEYLTMIGTVLDEQDVPEDGRFVVLPAWARWLIMNSDLKNASLTGDSASVIRRGRVGEVDRLTIYMSNLLSTVSSDAATNIIAGHKDAITFASQMVKNEVVPASRTFGKEYRGLQVYGYKVVKPEALVHMYAKKGNPVT
jgi:hypothetical protein